MPLASHPSQTIEVLRIMVSLEEEEEWDRLECWMGLIWLLLSPTVNSPPEDLERVMLSLLREQPSAGKKIEQWLQHQTAAPPHKPKCLEFLWSICEQASLEAASQQGALQVPISIATSHVLNKGHSRLISSINLETRESAQLPLSTLPLLVGDDTY